MSIWNRCKKVWQKSISIGDCITNVKFAFFHFYKSFFCFYSININVFLWLFVQIQKTNWFATTWGLYVCEVIVVFVSVRLTQIKICEPTVKRKCPIIVVFQYPYSVGATFFAIKTITLTIKYNGVFFVVKAMH